MSETLTIATANTYYGTMLRGEKGLQPFADRKTDVLLMQEVLGVDSATVEERLDDYDFRLLHRDAATGLAIAVNKTSIAEARPHTYQTFPIQHVGRIGHMALKYNLPAAERFRPRGALGAVVCKGAGEVTVGTAHPIVFVRARSRNRQIANLTAAFSAALRPDQAFVFGADMNHYPNPRQADHQFGTSLDMEQVPIGEPTWHIRGSKHEWLARIGSLATRRPLDSFDGQLDSLWYRGMEHIGTEVVEIQSDHKAIVSTFRI